MHDVHGWARSGPGGHVTGISRVGDGTPIASMPLTAPRHTGPGIMPEDGSGGVEPVVHVPADHSPLPLLDAPSMCQPPRPLNDRFVVERHALRPLAKLHRRVGRSGLVVPAIGTVTAGGVDVTVVFAKSAAVAVAGSVASWAVTSAAVTVWFALQAICAPARSVALGQVAVTAPLVTWIEWSASLPEFVTRKPIGSESPAAENCVAVVDGTTVIVGSAFALAAGTTVFDLVDLLPVPDAFVAVTVNRYLSPFVRPVTVIGLAGPLTAWPPCAAVVESVVCTVYFVMSWPLSGGGLNATLADALPGVAATDTGAPGAIPVTTKQPVQVYEPSTSVTVTSRAPGVADFLTVTAVTIVFAVVLLTDAVTASPEIVTVGETKPVPVPEPAPVTTTVAAVEPCGNELGVAPPMPTTSPLTAWTRLLPASAITRLSDPSTTVSAGFVSGALTAGPLSLP